MVTLPTITTSRTASEVRPLPSTGVNRLQRYYEPVRHPTRPGLSLTGIRLVLAGPPLGLPVFRVSPLSACRRHYPGGTAGCFYRSLPQRRWPSPYLRWVGSHVSIFEACSAFTHVTAHRLAKSPEATLSTRGSDSFVTSTVTPVATGQNDSCRAGFDTR